VSDWLLHKEYSARLAQLRVWLGRIDDLGLSISRRRDQIRELSLSRSWHEDMDAPLGEVLSQVRRSLDHGENLVQWLHLQRSRAEADEKGLSKLTALAETGRIAPRPDLQSAFRFVFYNTVARSVFADHPALFQFSGLTQDQIRTQFANADRDIIRLSRSRAAAILSRRAIPGGHQLGSVKTWTDLGLITHEIKKQKRHLPIRQLVSRAASALQALKPCFMMGPLSVAQYLPPDRLKFDLIVMDEASQLKPEDAIGAIARGSQLVVVGDPKQLPPTNFFQRLAVDEEDLHDDELTALEESESILDVASTLYQPVRRLRWHYRSQHHSLIAFSNREFYQGDLVIFPSAYHESPDLGVKYHSVRDGVFEQRRNAREAAAVVEAVLDHVQRRPNESLGVVALNFEQRELIEELLDARLRSDPFAAAYQERMEGGAEPLFVKNLENVQGDERDVIFISGTYGPDARGNQYQRFGPINGPNGHRRLNVLFTRARKRTEVFSSLDPDKIQTSAGSAFGLRALKQYLTFAKTGVLEAPDDGADEPANDFERSVGSILKENGFEVVPQVGVAGFFVDLGVRHPSKAGAYLLGIECDGATYHSGRSARDRDRLREEILVNQGWKIHRIWSTDWFKGRNLEVSRLLEKLQSLLDGDAEHQLAVQRAKKVSSLRSRLIALRDHELRVSFPDSSPEGGLLRDSLLDTFVLKRPRTRDEWFRVMSYDQRAQTDARQVGKYLDTVLQIIDDCSD
jgi:very-short-patch-repair endonuclease